MIKKSLIIASLLFATTSTMAENTFVGIDLGKSKLTASSGGASSTSESSFSIKGGKEFSDHRIYGKHLTVNTTGAKLVSLTAHYDKYLSTGKTKPFIGASIGYMQYAWNEDFGGDKLDMSGLAYGINLGILIESTKQLSFEFGYEHMLTLANDTACTTTTNGVCTEKSNINMDKYNNLRIGLNYKF